MEVEDFFPKYPSIESTPDEPDFMLPYKGETLEQALYNKKEFFDLKISKENEKEYSDDALFKQQKLISRFLSPYTLYDSILLFHEMGTGKSCAAFGVIENLRQNSQKYKGAIFVTKNESILNDLIIQLANECTGGLYVPDDPNLELREPNKIAQLVKKRIKELTNDFYRFYTLEAFVDNVLSKQTNDEKFISEYSNTIIVIDEIHNVKLYGTGENKQSNAYRQIYRLLHLPKNCKKIVMSGTPMTDKASEIADIMNLVLPEKRFPVGQEFEKTFLIEDENRIERLRPEKIGEFKSKIRGYVSYLKTSLSDIETRYNGTHVGPLTHFLVFAGDMLPFQREVYMEAYSKYKIDNDKGDKKPHDIYKGVEQASLFVFPDPEKKVKGIYGKRLDKVMPTIIRVLSEAIHRSKTVEEKLQKLREYSVTYANTIEKILQNPNKNTIVFNTSVHGSGGIVFSKILQMFDFALASGIESKKIKQKRFALITSETKQNLTRIKDLYNSPENMNGELLQVIIFSATIAEGVSFQNVQEIHVQTPHWNYSQTSQAIARGLRLNSHKDLIKSGQQPKVNIYLHCAIADRDNLEESIDLYKYVTSERKDVSIKNVEHYVKESAVDCQIFKPRNLVRGDQNNGSRLCDYMTCDYICEGISMDEVVPDLSTYKLYYMSKNLQDIINLIIDKFRQKFSLSISDLQRDENLSKFSKFELLSAIRKIIGENIVVINAYGFDCYVREKNNVLFLTEDLSIGSDFLSSSYTRYPIAVSKSSFEDVVKKLIKDPLSLKLLSATSSDEVHDIFELLLEKQQVDVLKNVLLMKLKNAEKDTSVLLQYFLQSGFIDGVRFDQFTFNKISYIYNSEDNAWQEKVDEEVFRLPKVTLSGYAGLYNPKEIKPDMEVSEDALDKYFKIQNVKEAKEASEKGKTRQIPTGRACISFNNPPKGHLLVLIGAKMPRDAEGVLQRIYRNFSKDDYKDLNEVQKLLLYIQKNFSSKISELYSEDNSIEDLQKAIVFNNLKAKDQCKLLFSTFKQKGALYEDPQKEGYSKMKKVIA